MSTYDMLREHYATRSDAELQAIGSTPDLPADAKRALMDELANRNADPETRRKAAIATAMAAMAQEKEDSIARSRRTLSFGIGVGVVFALLMLLYVLRQAFSTQANHIGALGFAVASAVSVVAAMAARRRKRAKREQQQSNEPPTS